MQQGAPTGAAGHSADSTDGGLITARMPLRLLRAPSQSVIASLSLTVPRDRRVWLGADASSTVGRQESGMTRGRGAEPRFLPHRRALGPLARHHTALSTTVCSRHSLFRSRSPEHCGATRCATITSLAAPLCSRPCRCTDLCSGRVLLQLAPVRCIARCNRFIDHLTPPYRSLHPE